MGKSSQLPSPGSVTPVMPWRTPWTPREVHHAQSGQNREFDSVRAAQGSVSSTSSRAVRGGKRQPQLPGGMEQERLVRGQQQRQLSLELLEVKALNRALSLQFRQGQYEIADMAHKGKELQRSNSALLTRIDESRALLDQFRREERRLSDALAKQAVLLMTEREARRNAEEEVERCRMALGAAPISSSSVPPVECSSKSGTAISNVAAEGSKATDSPARSKSSASDTTDNGPSLPELSAKVRLSLTGTVSTWIMDMQAACSSEIKEALVLPWLLQKLFYLCTELIEDRREDLVDLYLGGGDGAEHDDRMSTKLSAEASEFLHRHLRRHHKTLFPLSGPGQRIAIDKIMMALAYSMVESKEWDPSANDPHTVRRVLAASGLEKVVQEYLQIMAFCCLQRPMVIFTDDLGEVERYDPSKHSKPIDGEDAAELCMIVFPALLVTRDDDGEPEVVGQRFVLTMKG